jgi:hypothetical protein
VDRLKATSFQPSGKEILPLSNFWSFYVSIGCNFLIIKIFFLRIQVIFAARDPDPQIQLDIFRLDGMLCAGKGSKTLPYTHILDLAEDGFIKPHVDSARV